MAELREIASTVRIKGRRFAGAVLAVTVLAIAGLTPPPASAHPVAGELYYSRYLGRPNINKIPFEFDGETFTLGRKSPVAAISGADGLAFAPDGRLIVGGQGDKVHALSLDGSGARQTVSAGGGRAFHVAMEPGGSRAWATGTPGPLVEISLEPLADGVIRPLTGDDTAITSIAFDRAGHAYYTTGDDRGAGHFGTLDLATLTTRRLMSDLPAAHHITFEPSIGDLFLIGGNGILQIDPKNPTEIKSRLFFDQEGRFDQGTVDGRGHLFAARVDGHLLFVDFTVSGLIGHPGNFVETVFLDSNLDDLAPLSGPGSRGGARQTASRRDRKENAPRSGGSGEGGSEGGAETGSAGGTKRGGAGGSAGSSADAGGDGGDDDGGALPAVAAATGGPGGDATDRPANGGGSGDGGSAKPRGGGGAAKNRGGRSSGAGVGGGGGGEGGDSASNIGRGRDDGASGAFGGPRGATGQSEAGGGESGGMEEGAGEADTASAPQSSPSGILQQGLIVLLLSLAAGTALRLAGMGGPAVSWTLYTGGVAAAGPGYTIFRYFDFLWDKSSAGSLSAVPGAIEAAAVGAFILTGAAWLYRRTRLARAARRGVPGGGRGPASSSEASIADEISSELARGISLTGSRIGFVGRFSPGAPPRDLILMARRDGSSETGMGRTRAPARVTPEQLAILLDLQEVDTHPIFANGPRDEAIQRWLPKPLPEIKALLGMPIVEGGEPVGLLGLANSPHRYDEATAVKVAPVAESLAALMAESGALTEDSETSGTPSKQRQRKKTPNKKSAKKKPPKRKSRRGGAIGRLSRRGNATWRIPRQQG